MILLDMQGVDLSSLISLWWDNCYMIGGVGIILAALGVLKVMNISPENSKKKMITFLVGLLVFLVVALFLQSS